MKYWEPASSPKQHFVGKPRHSTTTSAFVEPVLIRTGNISRDAEALGLERSHLFRKMKALGIHLGE